MQLGGNPLGGHKAEPVPAAQDALRRGGLHRKSQHRRKAESPEDPQGILLKAPVRIADAANDPGLQVRPAAEAVGDPFFGGPGHGVDGEIPAGQILPEGAGEGDEVRAAAVGIGAVHPIGCDFQRAAVEEDGNGAVALPGGDYRKAREGGPYLAGEGRRGDVPVVGLPAQEAVPDAAAHRLGAVTGLLKAGQGLCYGGGALLQPGHWAMAAVEPRTRARRSAGASSTWVPIFPALTMMVGQARALSSRVVRKAFFIPMGEQPPRI